MLEISVIVITFNRTQLLTLALQSLFLAFRQANHVKFNLLIGVNGTDLTTTHCLENMDYSLENGQVQIFYYGNQMYPGAARNLLVSKVKTGWVYFFDDDCTMPSDFFQKFQKTEKEESEAAVIGGPNLTPPHSLLFQRLTGLVMGHPFGSGICADRYSNNQKKISNTDEKKMICCNLFIHRRCFENNGFPDFLPYGEENYLLIGLTRQSFKFFFDSSLFVFHERRSQLGAYVVQIYKYGYGRGLIVSNLKSLHIVYLIPVLFLVYLIGFSSGLLRFVITDSFSSIPMWSYLAMNLFSSIGLVVKNRLGRHLVFPVMGIFFVTHVAYAFGLILGSFDSKYSLRFARVTQNDKVLRR